MGSEMCIRDRDKSEEIIFLSFSQSDKSRERHLSEQKGLNFLSALSEIFSLQVGHFIWFQSEKLFFDVIHLQLFLDHLKCFHFQLHELLTLVFQND